MAGTTVNISIRMDAEMKTQAEDLFSELGLSFGAAVNVFVRQAVRQGGLPFKVTLGKCRGQAKSSEQEKTQPEKEGEYQKEYTNLEEFFSKLDAG